MQPKKVTELLLDSGIRVHVAPISRYLRNALVEEANAVFPYPDKAQYEVSLAEDVAIPGSVIPAEEHPEYQALVGAANAQRQDYIRDAMLNLCVTFPDFDSKESVMDHFAPRLDELSGYATLPVSRWQATLQFGVLSSVTDEAEILALAKDELPVTEAEITENLRIFRPAISREKLRVLDYARQYAPGADRKIQTDEQ